MANVLVIDDDAQFLDILKRLLTHKGHDVVGIDNGEEALKIVRDQHFDVVICDIFMKPVNGLDVLKAVSNEFPNLAMIMMTAYAKVDTALEALRMGAFDYLPKPFQIDDLSLTIDEALKFQSGDADLPLLDCPGSRVGSLIAQSPAMRNVVGMAERVGPADVTVLLRGEAGVEKESVARAIHDLSPRAQRPFVDVDCEKQSDEDLLTRMFGKIGDTGPTLGYVAQANGGTLWLNEIDGLSMEVQDRLANIYKSKTITPIGSEQAYEVDVRILAGTAIDIQAALSEQRIRPDLFVRFAPIAIEIPPLRERREDIIPLAMRFIEKQVPKARLERDAARTLLHYRWPGNVEELHEILDKALRSCDAGVVTSKDLPDDMIRTLSGATHPDGSEKPPARALRKFLRSKNVDPDAQDVKAAG